MLERVRSCLPQLPFRILKKIFCDHNYTLLNYANGLTVLDHEAHGTIEMRALGLVAKRRVNELRCQRCKNVVAILTGNHLHTIPI